MDNIFTQEEIRFLQSLYKQSGLAYVRYDQNGMELTDDEIIEKIVDNDNPDDDFNDADLLYELIKQTKNKINGFFELEIKNNGNDINLIKIV